MLGSVCFLYLSYEEAQYLSYCEDAASLLKVARRRYADPAPELEDVWADSLLASRTIVKDDEYSSTDEVDEEEEEEDEDDEEEEDEKENIDMGDQEYSPPEESGSDYSTSEEEIDRDELIAELTL